MRAVTTITVAAAAAFAGFAGFAAPAAAQIDASLVTGLSSGCASSLVGLVTNSNISSCLALASAVGALTSAGNASIVPGLNNYLSNNICASGKSPCTSSQLSAANSTLVQSCGSDLASNNGQNIAALVYYFINSYDKLRNAACLQNSKGESCLVEDMYALQNATNVPLSFTSIQSVISNQTSQQQALTALSVNKTVFCTDCTHGLYTTLFPTNSNQQVAGAVSQTCNSSFTDGKVPTTLKQTATVNSTSASASSPSNSVSSSSGRNVAASFNTGAVAAFGSVLAAVAAGFALF
ncbi:uncharacterized protein MEPE_00792 [Melanopsichium pennsylvanicum]|uniref:Uncharacterized protein n=2 Tax=Melanopsichium pennsylvanicum TaxID=63383 RepID=A0AAJ4XHF8_9BASI|nr:conserved hypothetical protein [Melanopsichium pennsylvanicum 4]SNX82086.1 uncharacterized protein MEPE_00792 [Melanopsichium pennsylvanicum]